MEQIESWFKDSVSDFLCERQNKPNKKNVSRNLGPKTRILLIWRDKFTSVTEAEAEVGTFA